MERNLRYSFWMLFDQKGVLGFLLLAAAALSVGLWYVTDSLLLGACAFGVFLLTFWQSFIPVSFEINANGIVRENFGQKLFIAWEDVQGYRVQPRGILVFPHTDRYPLVVFRSLFLPVPQELKEDVQRHFILFVEQVID